MVEHVTFSLLICSWFIKRLINVHDYILQALINEKAAPEILPFAEHLVTDLIEQITTQVYYLRSYVRTAFIINKCVCGNVKKYTHTYTIEYIHILELLKALARICAQLAFSL